MANILKTPDEIKQLFKEYQNDAFLEYCRKKIANVIQNLSTGGQTQEVEKEITFWTDAMADHEDKYYSALSEESKRQRKIMDNEIANKAN